MAGLKHCNVISTAFGAKACPTIDLRFSLYEIFFEMEKEGLVGKFYIIEPLQNRDNWLDTSVFQFHFDTDIDSMAICQTDVLGTA